MKIKGKKNIANATRKFCDKNGYRHIIQCIYNIKNDTCTGYELINKNSYILPDENSVSVCFSRPATMEEVEYKIINKLKELDKI